MLETLDFSLRKLSNFNRIGVCYSGGVDSHVLLHLLSRKLLTTKNLYALHVNHGISAQSDEWKKHSEKICRDLDIKFTSFDLNLSKKRNINENYLREARYEAIASWSKPGDILCTAHHKDDQVETILFRILRGTGINGLRGIPYKRESSGVVFLRPLIRFSKKEIIKYASLNNLEWVEDESNEDTSISRNFIRKELIPLVRRKWPKYRDAFEHISSHARDSSNLLDQLGDEDIEKCVASSFNELSIANISLLSKLRISNMLYRWLTLQSMEGVTYSLIKEIQENLLWTKDDSDPIITFGSKSKVKSFQLRKFNNILFLLPKSSDSYLKDYSPIMWDLNEPLKLPTGLLKAHESNGEGLSLLSSQNKVEVRFREGGERCRPIGRNKSQTLKRLLQEYSVPPWKRSRLPLIYVNGRLAAVADLWVCGKFSTKKKYRGISFKWKDNLFNKHDLRR